jgi:hypothetical protein
VDGKLGKIPGSVNLRVEVKTTGELRLRWWLFAWLIALAAWVLKTEIDIVVSQAVEEPRSKATSIPIPGPPAHGGIWN